jgi:predicted LPLAT superfamily acyltransferase
MSAWKGQSRGNTLGYSIFITIIKHFPLSVAYGLLRFVSFYFVLFSKKSHQYNFFKRVTGSNRSQSFFKIVKNNYLFGQVLVDKIAVLSGYGKKFTYTHEGIHHIQNMQNGGFLIGAHMGNWEIASELLENFDIKVNVLMLEAESEHIRKLLVNVQTKKKINIIPIQDDFSHLVSIQHALDRKELIVLHGDRFIGNAKSSVYSFFGKSARFPYGPFYLAAKFNKPISFVYALKESKSHYHFYASKPKEYPPLKSIAQRKEVVGLMTNEYVSLLEKMVKKQPEQWFNFYDFWEEE